jgi:hypothetical protein
VRTKLKLKLSRPFVALAASVAMVGGRRYAAGVFAFATGVAAALALASSSAAMPMPAGASARARAGGQSPAVAHLYWTEHTQADHASGTGVNTIWQANLDGTGINPNFVTIDDDPESLFAPDAIAVGGNYVYWDDGAINRTRIDGTHSQRAWIPQDGTALAVAPPFIYWTRGNSGLWREDLDGSHRQWVAAIQPLNFGLAVAGGYVYWISSAGTGGTIGRVDLNGTHANPRFITGLNNPKGLAVSNGRLYWADAEPMGQSSIARASLTGSRVQQKFITGVGYASSVAVGAGYLYWINQLAVGVANYPGAGWIGRARLNGTQVQPRFIKATIPRGYDMEPLDLAVGP